MANGQLSVFLKQGGLERGDDVVVHSSFRRIRHLVESPQDAVEQILVCIGPEGTLVLPTFNYSSPLPDPYYDPATTPARTGAIPEAGRRHPKAVRSLHPTHSVIAIGPAAEELTKDHLEVRAIGIGSPLDKLAARSGKVLLLGVGHTSNSTIHVAEEHAGIPKVALHNPWPRAKLRLPDSSLVEHPVDPSASCGAAFGGAEYMLRSAGLIRDVRAGGQCHVQLMRGADVIARVVSHLKSDPKILLCTNPTCERCRRTRERIDETL